MRPYGCIVLTKNIVFVISYTCVTVPQNSTAIYVLNLTGYVFSNIENSFHAKIIDTQRQIKIRGASWDSFMPIAKNCDRN